MQNFHVSYKRFQHPRLGRKRAVDEDDPWVRYTVINIVYLKRCTQVVSATSALLLLFQDTKQTQCAACLLSVSESEF